MKTTNILLTGVGGQGILLASAVLSDVLLKAGYDVKQSEVHGMAQRGGSVIGHVRFGEKVYSPLIEEGKADFILSFETLEALRSIDFLTPDGWLLVNDFRIDPLTVAIGSAEYPKNIKETLNELVPNLIIAKATKVAGELGNIRATNIVMLGILSKKLDIEVELWKKGIEACVKPRFVELNLKAFEAGRKLG